MATKKLLAGLTVALGLSLGAPAQAGYLSTLLTSGVDNKFEDQSREAFFDTGVGNVGYLGVGDVLVGFVRIDEKSAPAPAVDTSGKIYGIFTQQVISATATTVNFGPTTVVGLTLADLGVAGALATDMVAVYTNAAGFGTNLITTNPTNSVGGATITLADYLAYILANGELELRAGLTDPPLCTGGTSDCFGASVPGGTTNLTTALIPLLGTGANVATFVSGMETSLDPSGFVLDDVVFTGIFPVGTNTSQFTFSELALSPGTVNGANGVANAANWTDGSELGNFAQCGGALPCGFTDKADFTVHPNAVPEPMTLALLGVGLLGLGVTRRRHQRQS